MPRKPDPYLAQQWAQRLRRFQRSGVSVAQFCRQEGVSSAAFYQWKRRLKAAPVDERAQPAPRFVPLQIISSADDSDDAIQIRLPNGAVVRLPGSLDMHKVCQLVERVAACAPQEDAAC